MVDLNIYISYTATDALLHIILTSHSHLPVADSDQ